MTLPVSIAASILAADFADLGNQLGIAADCGVDYIHLDVMDGHFVDNISLGPGIAEAVARLTTLPIHAHLMITDPERYVDRFVQAGASEVTFHVEAVPYAHRLIRTVKSRGVGVGVALNPATPVETIDYIADELDTVLIMSVEPGFSGQEFIPSSLLKVETARRLIDRRGLEVRIAVDGGISAENAARVVRAGADIIVAGSGIFARDEICRAIEELKNELRRD